MDGYGGPDAPGAMGAVSREAMVLSQNGLIFERTHGHKFGCGMHPIFEKATLVRLGKGMRKQVVEVSMGLLVG